MTKLNDQIMEKLLYINNYNCPVKLNDDITANHMWGVDKLKNRYNITCAKVPGDILKFNFKGVALVNSIFRNFILFIRYFRYPIIYSACGNMTTGFAFANKLHIGKRRIYMIQHHGDKIWFPSSYSKIMFLSPIIANKYNFSNKVVINWGGCVDYAEHFIPSQPAFKCDFISAGKSGRDHECMIKVASRINAKTIIVAGFSNTLYDNSKVKVISGNSQTKNSICYEEVYKLYAKSRFIVIPIHKRTGRSCNTLSGLTTFVDAVILHKPVLISDNTNIGVDVESMGIGLFYRSGDEFDMKEKMEYLLSLSDEKYKKMCQNMESFAKNYTYDGFCKQLINIIDN